MCINGTIAAGEINTNFMVFDSVELVNGGLCTKSGRQQNKISLYKYLGRRFNNYLCLTLNFEASSLETTSPQQIQIAVESCFFFFFSFQ